MHVYRLQREYIDPGYLSGEMFGIKGTTMPPSEDRRHPLLLDLLANMAEIFAVV